MVEEPAFLGTAGNAGLQSRTKTMGMWAEPWLWLLHVCPTCRELLPALPRWYIKYFPVSSTSSSNSAGGTPQLEWTWNAMGPTGQVCLHQYIGTYLDVFQYFAVVNIPAALQFCDYLLHFVLHPKWHCNSVGGQFFSDEKCNPAIWLWGMILTIWIYMGCPSAMPTIQNQSCLINVVELPFFLGGGYDLRRPPSGVSHDHLRLCTNSLGDQMSGTNPRWNCFPRPGRI